MNTILCQKDTTKSIGNNLLNTMSLGYNGAPPKINLETYNFTAYIGDVDLDFYLFNSVPTLIPGVDNNEQQNRYVANDVLQGNGGLLNLAIGKVGFFGYGEDETMKYVKGFQADLRVGGKLMETPFLREESKTKFFPAVQSSVDLRYLIPLYNKNIDKDNQSIQNMVGNLSFRIQASAIKFFPKEEDGARVDPYSRYFLIYEDNAVVYPKTFIFAGSGELYFYVTNKIYFSAGYFFANDPLMDNYPFLSLSYGQ